MILEVDQSIKIEQTNTDTVLALANGETLVLVVPAAVKRECLMLLRRRGYQSLAITLKVFSKDSPAHKRASQVGQGERAPDLVLTTGRLLKML